MKRMTEEEFEAALNRFGLSQETGAEFLGLSPRTMYSWVHGEVRIQQPAAMLLRIMNSLGLKPGDPALNRCLKQKIE